jgi:hypothetical protein
MVFVVKESTAEAAAALMLADTWELDAVSGAWVATLLSDTALDTLLGDATHVHLLGEFSLSQAGAGPVSSQTIKVCVFNDLWKGVGGTPLNVPDPEAWLAARAAPVPLSLNAAPVNGNEFIPGVFGTGIYAASPGNELLLGKRQVGEAPAYLVLVDPGVENAYLGSSQDQQAQTLTVTLAVNSSLEITTTLSDLNTYLYGGGTETPSPWFRPTGMNGNSATVCTPDTVEISGGTFDVAEELGTAGVFGQDCVDCNVWDAYKCVRETPVLWVKLT